MTFNPQPKQKRWYSPKYEKWVRSLQCVRCASTRSIVHHAKGIGFLSGVGMKAPSWASIPVCEDCHAFIHSHPEIWTEQWEMISRTLGRAIEEGVLNVK